MSRKPAGTQKNTSVQRLATLGLFTAVALMIYGLESMLPTLVPIPGVKLGLANVVTLIVLKRFGVRDAFLVLLARILLGACFFGQLLSLTYSLCGGLFCMAFMLFVDRILGGKFIYLTSVCGAIAHNAAQITIAILITQTLGVLSYLPFLCVSAIVTGLFTGLCAHFTLKILPVLQGK